MLNKEQLKKEIAETYPGSNRYEYQVDTWGSITFTSTDWQLVMDLRNNINSFHDEILAYSLTRIKDYDTQKWKVDEGSTIVRAITIIKEKMGHLVLKCVDAKHPKKTTFYKELMSIILEINENSPALDDFLNILEYSYSVTKTESIESKTNDVHRANIFGLLSIIRKKYHGNGNGNSTSCTTNGF